MQGFSRRPCLAVVDRLDPEFRLFQGSLQPSGASDLVIQAGGQVGSDDTELFNDPGQL